MMSRSNYQFSDHDSAIVLQCLRFLVESWHLDGEFSTITGLTKDEMRAVMDAWPNVDYNEENGIAQIAVHSALGESCGGQKISTLLFPRYFTVTHNEIKDAFDRWQNR